MKHSKRENVLEFFSFLGIALLLGYAIYLSHIHSNTQCTTIELIIFYLGVLIEIGLIAAFRAAICKEKIDAGIDPHKGTLL